MYRCRLEELRKARGLSYKTWSEQSGISADTITRIIHPENPEKDSPKVNTLEALCKPLNTELWELFYCGDLSFVSLQAEAAALRTEREELLVENAMLKMRVETLLEKCDTLKDQIIEVHNHYIKKASN